MLKNEICFEQFRERLTEDETIAIRMWLGGHYKRIRAYQLGWSTPSHFVNGGIEIADLSSGIKDIAFLEKSFTSALSKAVKCTEIIFRGLWANNIRPERIEHLRSWFEGCGEITIHSHDSASISEKIGRSWTKGPDEKYPDLSVLLRIKPKTARYLEPFRHKTCDEFEVVTLKDSTITEQE